MSLRYVAVTSFRIIHKLQDKYEKKALIIFRRKKEKRKNIKFDKFIVTGK